MAWHPANLVFRFVLELAALAAFGALGWHAGSGPMRFVLAAVAIGVPAAVWAIFRVPNDGGRPVVAVPGIVRLGIELDFFGAAVAALAFIGHPVLASALGGAVIVHYAVSQERVRLLLANQPLPPHAAGFGARRGG
ncbi:MAG: YrdB family protein [Dehalococcoidia bacterium]